PGRSDEGLTGEVFAVARLLAHEHDGRGRRPLREDDLRGIAPQLASAALLGGAPQPGEICVLRHPALGARPLLRRAAAGACTPTRHPLTVCRRPRCQQGLAPPAMSYPPTTMR